MPDPEPLAQTARDIPDITETLAEEEWASIERTPSLYRPTVTGNAEMADGRYEVGERRGSGTTGSVYVAHDTDLDRTVAIKVLESAKGVDRFTREARIAAGLEHPNIVPVYDLDRTTDGRLCFTMRLVEGRSLGDAIRAPRGHTSAHEWIRVIRKVCDALSYAHHQGVLHQDVKPDNILLGRFGAVLLVDWGSASLLEEAKSGGRIVGTPVYLAPEVARGEPATVAADIYALGATLFHLLVGRYPMWEEDAKTFWQRKRTGGIDLPTAAERKKVPPALLAIVMHALAHDPAHRYPSVTAMADDLDRFQSGQSVSVYQDSVIEWAVRWHRRHARGFWATVVVLAVLAGGGWHMYGEWLKELATWGRPVISENFDPGSDWEKRWRVAAGSFEVRNGGLVSTAEMGSFAFINRRMEGATAIEYDGMMMPDQPPCDISVSYSFGDPFDANTDAPNFLLQVGANDNSYAQIVDTTGKRIAYNPLMLVPGRYYHIRMEIDGEVMRILVDGKLICEHREVVPVTSGWVGLYAFYPGKVFDNVRVFTKGMPQKVSALAVGDQYCLDGMWEKAAAYYRRVAAVHGDKAIGEEAAYRCGMALRHAGLRREAEAVWMPIANGRWHGRIRLHGLEDLLERKSYAEIAMGVASLYAAADEDLRLRLEALWSEAMRRAATPDGAVMAEVQALLAVREQYFPTRGAGAAAVGLFALRDFEGVLRRFPEQFNVASDSLLRLGRDEEVLSRYSDRRFQVGSAYASMGRLDELRNMKPPMPWLLAWVEGDIASDLKDFDFAVANRRVDRREGQIYDQLADAARLDRTEDLMRMCAIAEPSPQLMSAYLLLNRPEELLNRYPDWYGAKLVVQHYQAIAGFLAGAPVHPLNVPAPDAGWYWEHNLWFAHLFIRPFIAEITGTPGAMKAAAEQVTAEHRWHFTQQPWYCAGYFAGRIDEAAFLAQPNRRAAPPLLLVCQGMRSELEGSKAEALATYRRFLSLPSHMRCLHGSTRDPVVELFVRWRAQELGK